MILDLAAGIDPTVLRFARAADRLILVTTEEPTALTDAYAMVKLLRLQGAQVVPWVIVNMAENRVKGRKVFDQFALACNEYLGFKPQVRRRDLPRSARAGLDPRANAAADAPSAEPGVRRRDPHRRNAQRGLKPRPRAASRIHPARHFRASSRAAFSRAASSSSSRSNLRISTCASVISVRRRSISASISDALGFKRAAARHRERRRSRHRRARAS